MALKIITLIENHQGEHKGLAYEHGLAFFLECDDFRMLFDTGQSGKFIDNARKLNIDLKKLDAVALSHGHYDHSGGFRALTDLTTQFVLYTGKGFFNAKYALSKGLREFLGNDFDQGFITDKGILHQELDDPLTRIGPGVYVVTSFSRIHKDETVNPRFQIEIDGKMKSDLFEDEISVVVDTKKGLVVLLGCSHPGIKNILSAVSQRLSRPVYAIMGGTHLVEADHASLNLTIKYLKNKGVKVVGVSHCTGQHAMHCLAETSESFTLNRTGTSFSLEV